MLYENQLAEYLTDSKPRIFIYLGYFSFGFHVVCIMERGYNIFPHIPWSVSPIRDPFQILLKLKHESFEIYVIFYSILLAQEKTNQER